MDFIDIMKIAAFSMLIGYLLGSSSLNGFPDISFNRGRSSREADEGKKQKVVLMILVLVGSLAFARDIIVGSTSYGSTTIGGVLEKGSYMENFYVFVFPEASGVMSYRLKAEIRSYLKYDGFETRRIYEINRFILPGGGNQVFVKVSGSGYSLEVDRMVTVRDDSGKEWGIQLTRDKVE